MREPTHPPAPWGAALFGLILAFCGLLLAGPSASAARDGNPGGQAAPPGLPPTTVAAPRRRRSGPPRAPSRRPGPRDSAVPLVTEVLCLGRCPGGQHAAPVGGILVLHGRHIGRGMNVLFPGVATATAAAAAAHPTIGAKTRLSRKGFIVTVPLGAHSGRIVVVSVAGVRSRPFGPIRVLPARPPPRRRAPPAAAPVGAAGSTGPGLTVAVPAPAGSAFDGPALWIWYLAKTEAGNLDAIAARAQAGGLRTVFIKSSDGSTNFWSQFTPELVAALHQRGLHVCAWQYVYGSHPAGEAQLGAKAAAIADCLVIDAESEYEGKYAAAQTYIQTLRAAIGPTYPVGLASFPYVDRHESLPYSVFLGPGAAQFNLPQIYWHAIGVTVDEAIAHTYRENRIYARSILPLGQTYGGTPPAEIFRFRQLAGAYGATGVSFWDWQETTPDGWAALTQPLVADLAAVVDATAPLLAAGARGDQVVWMQEHLAGAEPQTPTTGIFDPATAAALLAFQALRGLPQTGTTDPATWQALLALAPVAVDWTVAVKPG